MSRVAKKPIQIPEKVSIEIEGKNIRVEGPKGSLSYTYHDAVKVYVVGGSVLCSLNSEYTDSGRGNLYKFAGTTQAIVQNMLKGVTEGFEKTLQLVGVGYRGVVEKDTLTLLLGYSHPCKYQIPVGVSVACPSQTEILVKGLDKQLVGQVAADIRSFRPPEPYKGKGVRYKEEQVLLKEAKKK